MEFRAASWLLVLAVAPSLCAEDAVSIVRKSVARDSHNWAIAKDYTYLEEREERPSGQRKTFEVTMLYGQPYRRLMRKNGQPLPENEERKEREKFEKAAAERRDEKPEKRRERLAEFEKRRAKEREFFAELPEAFTFALVGEENVNGRRAWVLDATPRPGYTPRLSQAKMLKHMKGRLWVDQSEYQFVKAETDTLDTISFGLFVARLQKGAHISFEQIRVNDEVWMPKRAFIRFDARVALLMRVAGEQEITWRDYRKFRADSTFVPLADASLSEP